MISICQCAHWTSLSHVISYLDKTTFDGFHEMEHHFLWETPIVIIFHDSLSQPPYYHPYEIRVRKVTNS